MVPSRSESVLSMTLRAGTGAEMKRVAVLINGHQSRENIGHRSHLPGKRSPIIVLATAARFLAKVRVPQVLLKLPWSLLLYLVARRAPSSWVLFDIILLIPLIAPVCPCHIICRWSPTQLGQGKRHPRCVQGQGTSGF